MAEEKRFNLTFEFIDPPEHVLATARKFLDSPGEKCRAVAKALLDATAAGQAVRNALTHNQDADLAPYFDSWFADAVNAAQELQRSDDKETRNLADALIVLEQASIKSKENFLGETKRLGIKPQK